MIEVGVDVPEATVMVIENAERFGLAQLHQLRGRVGRGSGRSTCVALHGRLSEDSRQRLEIFGATSDGFELAEADLEMRGPGDLLGTRQAGIPSLQLVDLVKHRHWIESARRDARALVARRAADGESFLTADVSARAPFTLIWRADEDSPGRQHPAAGRSLGRRRAGAAAGARV